MPATQELTRPSLPALWISPSGRCIERESGRPLFLLADTAWLLFNRTSRLEVGKYIADRAAKGFNVIQAAVVAETKGAPASDIFDESPLLDQELARLRESYFERVDWVVDVAASRGLYMAMVLVRREAGPASSLTTVVSALGYGEWLGRRYKNQPVLWVLDSVCLEQAEHDFLVVHALARGLRKGDAGACLVTCRSSDKLGASNPGQEGDRLESSGNKLAADLARTTKAGTGVRIESSSRLELPVVELVPNYEDSPIEGPKGVRYSNAADVRRAFYRGVFSGTSGHCYGHPSICQFFEHEPRVAGDPLMDWQEALLQPGAFQVGLGRRLVESRPMEDSQPDDSILVPSVHLSRDADSRPAAMREVKGRWAMVYVPEGRPCTVRLDRLSATSIKVWRYDPRTGAATGLGVYPACGTQKFAPPVRGERLDWLLVFDDAALERSAPGVEIKNR